MTEEEKLAKYSKNVDTAVNLKKQLPYHDKRLKEYAKELYREIRSLGEIVIPDPK